MKTFSLPMMLIAAGLFFAALWVSAASNCLTSCSQTTSCPPTPPSSSEQPSCGNLTQPYRFCRCDAECSFFGDCCGSVDTFTSNSSEPPRSLLDWQCRSTGGRTEQPSIGDIITAGLPHVLMVATCDPLWLHSHSLISLASVARIQQQCENPDILPASPVTSNASGITYANLHCAQCNGERFVDLVFWLQQYACPMANSTMEMCTVFWRFVEPNITFIHPVARPCIPKVISVCPSNFSNQTIVQRCRAYSDPVVWAGKIFKNVECALCNDVLTTVPLATCAMTKLQGYTHTTQELDIAQMYFDGCYSYRDSDFFAPIINSSQYTVPNFEDISFNCSDVDITTLCLGYCSPDKRDVNGHYTSYGRAIRAPHPTNPGHNTSPQSTSSTTNITNPTMPPSTTTTSPPAQSTTTTLPPAQSTTTTPPPAQSTTTTPPPAQSTTTTRPPAQSTTTTPPPAQSTTTTPPPAQSTTTTPPPAQSTTTTPPPAQSTTTTPPPAQSTTTTPPPAQSTTTTPPPAQEVTVPKQNDAGTAPSTSSGAAVTVADEPTQLATVPDTTPFSEGSIAPTTGTQSVPNNNYKYTTRPSYSLLFDIHSSGYDIIEGDITTTSSTVAKSCIDGEVYLPGDDGGHCVPIVIFPQVQCSVMPTSGITRRTSDGLQNSTLVCSYGFNNTFNYTCVQVTQNNTQYNLLQQNISNFRGDGFIGNVSGGQIFKFNGTILFCSNLSQQYREIVLRNITTFPQFTTTMALEILTYIGCSLSIIGSCILFLTYSILKELRNLPGKLVMNLGVAILLSDLVLMGLFTANVYFPSTNFCAINAVLLHYTFLARFVWMTIISIHLASTLVKPFHFSNKRHAEWKILVAFIIIGWCLPLLIVALCIVLNFSPNHLVGYGNDGRCWITDQRAFIGAFVAPVSVSIFINLLCFTAATIAICRAKIRGNGGIVRNYASNLRTFAALSSLMGVTWIFGFIALAADSVVPWYFFIVLNSTQGLFVAVMMLCKWKTVQICRSHCGKLKGGQQHILKSSSTRINFDLENN